MLLVGKVQVISAVAWRLVVSAIARVIPSLNFQCNISKPGERTDAFLLPGDIIRLVNFLQYWLAANRSTQPS